MQICFSKLTGVEVKNHFFDLKFYTHVLFFHNRLAYENIVPQETHLSLTEKLINLGLQKFDTVVPTVYSN